MRNYTDVVCRPRQGLPMNCVTMGHMNEREELGALIRRRRAALDLTQEDVAERGGPSTTTQSKIEAGDCDSTQPASLRRLEQVLHWKPGAIRRYLDTGIKPEALLTHPPSRHTQLDLETSIPADVVKDLDPIEIEEVVTAAKLAAIERARRIRGRRDPTHSRSTGDD